MITIRTEAWTTKNGIVIKAVARDDEGKFLGATNQTQAFELAPMVVGAK